MATRLRKLRVTKVALVAQGANQEADVLLFKQANTKTEDGVAYPKSDYAYTPSDLSSEWTLRLTETPAGEPTTAQVWRAIAALGAAGFRGNRVEIPDEDLSGVKRRVLTAWRQTHPEAVDADIPTVLKGSTMRKDKHHEPYTTEQKLQYDAAYDAWCKVWWAFRAALDSIAEHADADSRGQLFMQSVAEFVTRARPLFEQMGMEESTEVQAVYLAAEGVTKAGRVMAAERVTKLQDAIALLHAILADAIGSYADETAMKGIRMAADKPDETVLKRAETAEARCSALEADLVTVQKALADLQESLKPPPTEEEFLKTLPVALRARWEDDHRRLEAAETVAKSEKAQRERQDYIQKTAGYRAVGMVPDDDWEIFKSIDALEEKPRVRLLQLLKSANEVIKASVLLGEIGGSGPGTGDGTAYAAIEALALELVKGGTLTKEQAIVKALDARPDLMRQYHAERKEARHGR